MKCSYNSLLFTLSTRHRYGDVTPTSDEGKLAVAMYAILVTNVIGGLLQPARSYLESLCRDNSAPVDVPTKED